jgi:hypothetical protein
VVGDGMSVGGIRRIFFEIWEGFKLASQGETMTSCHDRDIYFGLSVTTEAGLRFKLRNPYMRSPVKLTEPSLYFYNGHLNRSFTYFKVQVYESTAPTYVIRNTPPRRFCPIGIPFCRTASGVGKSAK